MANAQATESYCTKANLQLLKTRHAQVEAAITAAVREFEKHEADIRNGVYNVRPGISIIQKTRLKLERAKVEARILQLKKTRADLVKSYNILGSLVAKCQKGIYAAAAAAERAARSAEAAQRAQIESSQAQDAFDSAKTKADQYLAVASRFLNDSTPKIAKRHSTEAGTSVGYAPGAILSKFIDLHGHKSTLVSKFPTWTSFHQALNNFVATVPLAGNLKALANATSQANRYQKMAEQLFASKTQKLINMSDITDKQLQAKAFQYSKDIAFILTDPIVAISKWPNEMVWNAYLEGHFDQMFPEFRELEAQSTAKRKAIDNIPREIEASNKFRAEELERVRTLQSGSKDNAEVFNLYADWLTEIAQTFGVENIKALREKYEPAIKDLQGGFDGTGLGFTIPKPLMIGAAALGAYLLLFRKKGSA